MKKEYDACYSFFDPETALTTSDTFWFDRPTTFEAAKLLADNWLKNFYQGDYQDKWETEEIDYGEIAHYYHDFERGLSFAIYENDVDLIAKKYATTR